MRVTVSAPDEPERKVTIEDVHFVSFVNRETHSLPRPGGPDGPADLEDGDETRTLYLPVENVGPVLIER